MKKSKEILGTEANWKTAKINDEHISEIVKKHYPHLSLIDLVTRDSYDWKVSKYEKGYLLWVKVGERFVCYGGYICNTKEERTEKNVKLIQDGVEIIKIPANIRDELLQADNRIATAENKGEYKLNKIEEKDNKYVESEKNKTYLNGEGCFSLTHIYDDVPELKRRWLRLGEIRRMGIEFRLDTYEDLDGVEQYQLVENENIVLLRSKNIDKLPDVSGMYDIQSDNGEDEYFYNMIKKFKNERSLFVNE